MSPLTQAIATKNKIERAQQFIKGNHLELLKTLSKMERGYEKQSYIMKRY